MLELSLDKKNIISMYIITASILNVVGNVYKRVRNSKYGLEPNLKKFQCG